MMVSALIQSGKKVDWDVLDKTRISFLHEYVEYIKNGIINR
jgi:hypothetical protein